MAPPHSTLLHLERRKRIVENFKHDKLEMAPLTRMMLMAVLSTIVSGQELGDFDEVETYTRILLRPKNASLVTRPRADPGGPLIIDYPFPIHHHHPPPQKPEYALRPATQIHPVPYSGQTLDTHEGLTSWHNYGAGLGHPSRFFPPKKKKKKYLKKSYKHLIPLLITVAAKVTHLLPTVKLMLLALFSLLLFAKKAFLVSVGTFLLVMYEHFTSKNSSSNGFGSSIGLWKDRGQAVVPPQDIRQPYGDQSVTTDIQSAADWWRLEGVNGTKITPRDGERWRRWWAPQVKRLKHTTTQRPPQLEEQTNLKDRIKENLRRIFGSGDPNT